MTFDRSEFLSTFNDEARDHLQKLNQGLLALEKDPGNAEIIEEMFRSGHTLKGAARMMGFEEIKEVSHCIEDVFGAIHNKKITLDAELTTLLFRGLDTITSVLDEVVQSKAVTVPWKEIVDHLHKTLEDYLSGQKKKNKKNPESKSKSQGIPASQKISPPENPRIEEELSFSDVKKELEEKGLLHVPLGDYTEKAEGKTPDSPKSQSSQSYHEAPHESDSSHKPQKTSASELEEFIKVPINKINKLLNLVGEMVINKINSNEKVNSTRRFSRFTRQSQKKFQDLYQMIINNHTIEQLPNFNEIKLYFHDINTDLIKLRDDSTVLFDEIALEVSQLDPIIDELQLRMKQIRMLPVGNLFETMPRLVRDIAVAQNKQIELKISGEETEVDKKVLESIKASLIHLLRNSVDHGIELPQERFVSGKGAKGTICLRSYHKGGNVVIEIEDDGRGINVQKIKEIALRRGLTSVNEVATMADSEIMSFIFYPGFSTAPIITDISGRGVGLDVVKTDIEALKGSVLIQSELGKGTKFILQLPLTVAIIQSLLVRSENEIFAIPLLSVEESICIDKKDIFSIENRSAIRLRNRTISVVRLKDIVQVPPAPYKSSANDINKTFIVILNSMEKLLGIEVDEIMGEQEVFIKSLDEHLGKLKNISGATILGNGQVIIILDILDIFESSKNMNFSAMSDPLSLSGPRKENVMVAKKRILIVEDSMTTRELEKSILQSHGYEVDTCVDGLNALNHLQNHRYDLIVSDVEMPRMDGFELCRSVKQITEHHETPFIIVSSLDREEDKRKGIEVGAQAYIIKNAFDQSSLVDTIRRLIG